MKRNTRIFTLLTLFVLAMFIFVPAASAYDGRGGDKVVVSKDEVINDDLFVGGTEVIVDGTVNGDLIAGGRIVTINGKVTGNVIAAGSSVTVNGEVGYDVIAMGAVVTLGPNGKIGHNAYTAGASVETQSGSQIGGSLLIGAGQSLVSGQITNDLLSGGASLRLEGTVGRNAKVAVDSSSTGFSNNYYYGPNMPVMPSVPAGLTFGPEAHVAGSLEYVSQNTAAGAENVASTVKHTLPPQDAQIARELRQQNRTSSYVFDALRRLIALLLVGLLIAWLAPRWITGPAQKLLSRPLPSLGMGLVSLIAVPFSLVIAFGVVVLVAVIFGLLSLGALTGLSLTTGLTVLSLVGIAFGFVLSYVCQAVVAFLGGRWILSRIRPEWNNKIIWSTLLGLFITGLLIAIPVAGGLLQFVIVLAGLGAIALLLIPTRPAPTAPAEVPAVVQQ